MKIQSVVDPILSVIVPVYNDLDGLTRCLRALNDQSLPSHLFEVLVVDNGSTVSLAPALAIAPAAELISESKPGSYAARNAGARAAKGQFLAFTDADCQPEPQWLQEALKVFASDPSVDAIGGQISLSVSASRRVAELYERVFSPFPQDLFVRKQGFAATANLVVRAEVFWRVGPFHETLLSSGDREWGNRLVAASGRLVYAPACLVHHPARRDIRSLAAKRRRITGGMLTIERPTQQQRSSEGPLRIHPPRRRLTAVLLFRPWDLGLRRIEGLQVLLLAIFLVGVRLFETARIRLGGAPVR